jgi:hypothetical protein
MMLIARPCAAKAAGAWKSRNMLNYSLGGVLQVLAASECAKQAGGQIAVAALWTIERCLLIDG